MAAPVVIERLFNSQRNTVWRALTEKGQMKEWYFDVPEFKPEVGCEFSFSAGDEKNPYLHRCKITEVIPGKKIQYTWRYEGYPGNSLVTFELFDEGDETRLKLTHEGLETFPATNPDMAKGKFVEGWTHILNTSLKAYLAKKLS